MNSFDKWLQSSASPDVAGLTQAQIDIMRIAFEAGASPATPGVAQKYHDDVPLAWRNTKDGLVEYILQNDLHNRYTPRIVDIAYTAFMSGSIGKNPDDGGPCDWFNDTRPTVMRLIADIKKDLSAAEDNERRATVVSEFSSEHIQRAISTLKHQPWGVGSRMTDCVEFAKALIEARDAEWRAAIA